MKNFKRKRFIGAFIFVAVFGISIAVVMLLWNALLPSIFGIVSINFWQAAGLMILSRLLLGGFGRFGRNMPPFFHYADHDKKKGDFFEMHRKMCNMTPEQRMSFIHRRMTDTEDGGEKQND